MHEKTSAVKRLIAINRIQNKSFVYIIYVYICTVYMYYVCLIYTDASTVYIKEKYVMFTY